MHFAQRSRLKKAIEIQLVGFGEPIVQLLPVVDLKIVRYYGYRKRAFDLDNLYGSVKLLVDAMRSLEIIAEDTPKHISLTVEQEKSPDKSTFVTIDASELRKDASI